MAKPTLKEQLAEVSLLLDKDPGNGELIAQKAEIEAKLAKVEVMQAGKKTVKTDPIENEPDVKKKSGRFMINGRESTNYILCDVIKLEKVRTNKKTADGTLIWDLKEAGVIKQVKIVREHLPVHEEQEINTLKRYREAK